MLPALVLALLPLGIFGGFAWAWRRSARDTAGFVRWGTAGGALGGLLASLLASVLPGDWRGFGLLGSPWLGAALGAILGLAAGVARAAWLLLRRRPPAGRGLTNR